MLEGNRSKHTELGIVYEVEGLSQIQTKLQLSSSIRIRCYVSSLSDRLVIEKRRISTTAIQMHPIN